MQDGFLENRLSCVMLNTQASKVVLVQILSPPRVSIEMVGRTPELSKAKALLWKRNAGRRALPGAAWGSREVTRVQSRTVPGMCLSAHDCNYFI